MGEADGQRRAAALMHEFADRTGVTSEEPADRYLWTDAFAVCNFLGLAHATGDDRYPTLARRLVGQVHRVLGRHRDDDPRTGWISGLSEQEGERHPTRGGLRIGKPLPERGPDEPFDPQGEWDRDGQYFHYLTKWMHALDQLARVTGRPAYNGWARELAQVAHDAFTYVAPEDGKRMHWKMSIELSRPLVASMGQHDPLDGFVTCLQLQSTASQLGDAAEGPAVGDEARQLISMAEGSEWATADPLGIGGLLMDAARVHQLMGEGAVEGDALLGRLLDAALAGLQHYAEQGEHRQPAERRLAFRELGLVIGLHGVQWLWERARDGDVKSQRVRTRLEDLTRFAPLRAEIQGFWSDPKHRANSAWTGHRNINDVMLATAMVPEGVLILPEVP